MMRPSQKPPPPRGWVKTMCLTCEIHKVEPIEAPRIGSDREAGAVPFHPRTYYEGLNDGFTSFVTVDPSMDLGGDQGTRYSSRPAASQPWHDRGCP